MKLSKIALILLCAFSFSFGGGMLIKDGDKLIEINCKEDSCRECILKCEDIKDTKEKITCASGCDAEIKMIF